MKTGKSRQALKHSGSEVDHAAVDSSLLNVCNRMIPFNLCVSIRLKAL